MRFPHVSAIDRVTAVDQAGSHDQLVNLCEAGVVFERGGELGAGVAAQHHGRADVAGVATRAGDVARVVAEAVVVFAHRHDRRVAHVPDRAACPLGLQRGHHGVEQGLNSVCALGR